MFAILEILPRMDTYKNRLLEKYKEPEISLEKLECGGASPYYIMRVRERRSGIPWSHIEHAAGVCRKKMIIPPDIEIPSECSIERYVPSAFPARLLCNTAYRLMRVSPLGAKNITCTVIDREGDAAEYISMLIPVCSKLKVVTGKTDVYESVVNKMLESYGAGVTVAGDDSTADGSNIVIYCGVPRKLNIKCHAVLTCYNTKIGGYLATGRVAAPKSLYIPMIEGVSKFEILSAMYEHCGAQKLDGLYARTLLHNSREIPVSECGKFLTISQKTF